MISLDDVVLRDELDPRVGDRDDDLIAQYADIFDALPPIEINQDNEVIDGWHRVLAAEHPKRTEIAYVVVETRDDDLSDRMWESNLRHGVQYTRPQRKTHGIKLHGRGLVAKDIAQRVGVSQSSVYSCTKELREKEKQERDAEIARLRDEGRTQQKIADETGVPRGTIARNVQNSNTGKMNKEPESVEEPTIEADEVETGEEPEAEPTPPEAIPDHILETARAVMGNFSETRPDDYVAKLEASGSEWMTITDDSLSNAVERELLTSAAAMRLWQEWMIWYQGGRASAFTDAFGKIGPVFVRGQAGQWRLVSRLRSILRRLWA